MVAYSDLLRAAQNLSTNYGNLVVAFLVVGVIYIAINAGLTSAAGRLERRTRMTRTTPNVVAAGPDTMLPGGGPLAP